MSKTLRFKSYCFVLYMAQMGLSGREVKELFAKFGVLSYINEFYDVLHSASDSYIVDDISRYIQARNNVAHNLGG